MSAIRTILLFDFAFLCRDLAIIKEFRPRCSIGSLQHCWPV